MHLLSRCVRHYSPLPPPCLPLALARMLSTSVNLTLCLCVRARENLWGGSG